VELRSVLAAALRGEGDLPPASQWNDLIESAEREGVLPLLADAAMAARWDPRFIAATKPFVAAEAALTIVRERELRRLLAGFDATSIKPLLIKGAHLAFTLYPSPDRRPRVDTDLLINEADRERASQALEALGYIRSATVSGDVAFAQAQYSRVDQSGAHHTIDVHWGVANPKAFRDRLTYDDLIEDAIAIPTLGPHACAPSAGFALLIACLHRTAHHGSCMRLVWLYDIHLLAAQLSDVEWDDTVTIAARRGLSATVTAGLDAASAMLGTTVPSDALDRLRLDAADTDPDVRAFLESHPAKIDVALSDWKRLDGWPARVRFLREHLFPSALYMRQHYNTSSSVALPFIYAHRIVAGGVRWLRRVE
jgi:putative nucleotidyltransferase-like protein